MSTDPIAAVPCELCGDQPAVTHLRPRCHFTAPLRAELHGDTLKLFCYVPECNRLVVTFRVAATDPSAQNTAAAAERVASERGEPAA